MIPLANVLVGFVAVLHVWFLVLEMFLVRTPMGMKLFQLTETELVKMLPLFQNQGLYNGFLAAGLIWSLLHPDPVISLQLKLFFLVCVIVAGVFGAMTALRSIIFLQALPGALALAAVWLAHGR
jgi:putative membrane protein